MASETAKLLEALFLDDPDSYIELRVINRATGARQEWFSASDTAAAAARAVELRDRGDVYFGVVPRIRREGTKDAVGEAQVVWADVDSADAVVGLAMFGVAPSIVVASGSTGCYHAYWLLTTRVSAGVLEDLNRRLANRLGADQRATDCSRVLRLPGTLNHKTDPPAEVTLADFTGQHHAVEALDAALGTPPSTTGTAPSIQAPAAGGPLGPSERVANVLARLEEVREGGSGWTASCPAHDDQRPSLSISQGDDGRCLLHCHAGCTPDAVVAAIGLGFGDLFPHSGAADRPRDRLLRLTDLEEIELFHDPTGQGYAKITVGTHRETWALSSSSFEQWVQHAYYRHYTAAPPAEAVREAIAQLSARARFDASERPVHRRVGGDLERLWVDLGDPDWTCAEIRDDGTWQLTEGAPIEFVREPGMIALPYPTSGGDIELVRPLLNLSDPRAWTLFRGSLIAAYHPTGPYFVLFLHGSAGSGKTEAARRYAHLVDPFSSQFLKGTASETDAIVVAAKCRLLGIDNMSRLTRAWSDTLCVISTGGGDRRRQLYTDGDLFSLEAKGPTLVTALVLLATRGDLIDRVVPMGFERISDSARCTEAQLKADFAAVAPTVMGGVFDAVATALRHGHDTHLDQLPRMADATLFVTAAEHALSDPVGTFAAALIEAQAEALSDTIQTSPFIEATVRLMTDRLEWRGSVTRLTEEAAKLLEHGARTPGWPANASVAGAQLGEYELPLAAHDITVQRDRTPGGNRDRFIALRRGTDGTGGTGTTDGMGTVNGA